MNKTALITGAADGIGKEMAKAFAEKGHNLVLVDINEDKLQSTVNRINKDFPLISVQTIATDLCQEGAVDRIYAYFKEHLISCDILINNAGFGTLGLFAKNEWEREKRMIRLHIESLTHLCKYFVPEMISRGDGSVLNVASVAGFLPSPLMAVYNASKAYVISFSEALANEVGSSGVSVSVLCPGLTRTGFQAAVGVGEPDFTKNRWLSLQPEEVAALAIRSMEKNKLIIIPGRINRFMVFIQKLIPRRYLVKMVRRVQERNRKFIDSD